MPSAPGTTPGPGQVPVGFIKRAHGIRGGVLVVSLSDAVDRFVVGARFTLSGEPETTVAVTAVSPHGEGVILQLAGIDDRTTAERIAKSILSISEDERRPLEEDEFWPGDLIGLAVCTASGDRLGTVEDVILGAAQDRIVVTATDGSRVEVPFVSALVPEIDRNVVVMDPPSGLFPSLEGE